MSELLKMLAFDEENKKKIVKTKEHDQTQSNISIK